jgi:hypothetical protein
MLANLTAGIAQKIARATSIPTTLNQPKGF